MSKLSYISGKARIRRSSIHGKGLFAVGRISAGEVVAAKGGHIFNGSMRARLNKTLGPAEIQIGEDLFIGPVTSDERDGSMLYINHSCEPNVGVNGQIVFVAMRDIEPGEELTHDWAMTDDDEGEMECNCGSKACRGKVTGKDWQKKSLQKKYRGFMSSYLVDRIKGSGNPK